MVGEGGRKVESSEIEEKREQMVRDLGREGRRKGERRRGGGEGNRQEEPKNWLDIYIQSSQNRILSIEKMSPAFCYPDSTPLSSSCGFILDPVRMAAWGPQLFSAIDKDWNSNGEKLSRIF